MIPVDEVRKKLNKVSSCFCLAKWTTVTFHLESGTAHSCHHPKVHSIGLNEIKDNPAGLHNTEFKIEQRKKMMNGERPSECQYCWNVEDLDTNQVSDRILKSSAPYSISQIDSIIADPYSKKIIPKYVEVSFSNTCQFKCSYCSANFSSTWQEELDKFGQYSTGSGVRTDEIFKEEENEYVKSFWKWWPDLKKEMHTFRITGGEPLLSPSTFKTLENLLEDPQPHLWLAINSNLGAPQVLVDKFIDYAGQLCRKKAVSKFEVYTSIDAFGAKAEYIRNGLKHDYFWSNIDKLLSSNEEIQIVIMCTFNALSVTSFIPLLENIRKVNKVHANKFRRTPLEIDISYLRNPEYQTVQVLPDSYIPLVEEIVQYVESHQMHKSNENLGFHDFHIYKAQRVLEWMKSGLKPEEKKYQQKRFYEFFSEHDRRRNTNFLEKFPEMTEFWNHCKSLNG